VDKEWEGNKATKQSIGNGCKKNMKNAINEMFLGPSFSTRKVDQLVLAPKWRCL
jgi:hypothetical protein